MATDKIGCITVCRNDKKGLLETVASALAQTHPLDQMIIIDGDSTDGTKELLPDIRNRLQEKGIDAVIVSEPDTGIYNAMNKGIKLAHAKWLVFMNAGDCFAGPDVIQKICEQGDDNMAIIYGDWLCKHGEKEAIRKAAPFSMTKKKLVTSHQAFYIKTELLKKRPYDETFRITADYDWMMYAYENGYPAQYIPIPVCVFDMSGVSNTNFYQACREGAVIRAKNNIIVPAPIQWLKERVAKFHDWLLKKTGFDISFLWQ